MNNLIKTLFENEERITLCYNNNFAKNGRVLYQLFFNDTKLSRNHGIRVLAGNLKRSIFPRAFNSDRKPFTQEQKPMYRPNAQQSQLRFQRDNKYDNQDAYRFPTNNNKGEDPRIRTTEMTLIPVWCPH